MANLEDELAALVKAQPTWRADNLGVRGNPVEFHKEQARVDWPPATITHRGQGVNTGEAVPGYPGQKESTPAS